jgi:hypothetical protein
MKKASTARGEQAIKMHEEGEQAIKMHEEGVKQAIKSRGTRYLPACQSA